MNVYEATQTTLARRKALGLGTKEAGEAAGILQHTLRDLEQGRSVPKLDTFLDLCEALDIEVQLVPKEQLLAQQAATYASQQEVLEAIGKLARCGLGLEARREAAE